MRFEVKFGLALMAVILIACVVLFPAPSEMTNGHVGLLMLALVVFAIMIGFPAAFTLMGMGVLFSLYAFAGDPARTLDLVVQRAYAVMTNDVLISIPLFVFMGYLVERANLISKLFHAMHLALARMPGALAVATLATCALFATATGIVGAVVTVMGLLALPVMLRAGYDVRLASGVITAGGCLGILIPPSIMLIVYSATAGVSVVQLYAGAMLPGLMLAGLYVAFVIVVAKLRPALAPPLPVTERRVVLPSFATGALMQGGDRALPALAMAFKGRRNSGVPAAALLKYSAISIAPLLAFLVFMGLVWYGVTPAEPVAEEVLDAAAANVVRPSVPAAFWASLAGGAALLAVFYGWFTLNRLEMLKMLFASFFPLAALIFAVLGTIIFGLATPTEAAAIGSLGGMLLALAYRQLNWGVLQESVALTAKTSAMVCWLFVGSSIFSAAFALLGGQELIEQWVLAMDLTPLQFMVLAQVIIFLLGWPLDWAEIIVIFVPIFVPLLAHFNIDPLFFGLLVALNLQTAFLSPPVAMAAFYLRGVAPPGVTLNQIFAGMLPFMAIQVLAIILLYVFPEIGLWLPQKIYG
jgi:TRAP-type mannitol/chloroaromatic compound transport system permease large subunit